MAPTVAAQGQWFFGSVLLGVLLALIYHFLRAFRHRFPKGTVLADLVFLGFTGWALAYLGLVICGGIFQLPQVAGLGLGAWVYKLTGYPLLQGIFGGFWGVIGKFFHIELVVLKKIWKKIKKTAKYLFSIGRKWVTIKRTKMSNRDKKAGKSGSVKNHGNTKRTRFAYKSGGRKASYGFDSRSHH